MWTNGEKMALATVVVGIIAAGAAVLVVPEVRAFLGLSAAPVAQQNPGAGDKQAVTSWAAPVKGDDRFHLIVCRIRADNDIACFFTFMNSSVNPITGGLSLFNVRDNKVTSVDGTEATDQFGHHLVSSYCGLGSQIEGFDDCINRKNIDMGSSLWGMVGFVGGVQSAHTLVSLRIHYIFGLGNLSADETITLLGRWVSPSVFQKLGNGYVEFSNIPLAGC